MRHTRRPVGGSVLWRQATLGVGGMTMNGRTRGWCGVAAVALLLASCGTPPPVRKLACSAAVPPAITQAADGQTKSMTLKVLTYNIEGLGFPARNSRGPDLAEIARRLSAMRIDGTGPDVILFQEMFSGAAKGAVAASGYPAITPGPAISTRPSGSTTEKLPGKARLKHGEVGIRFQGSGLAIASRYPVIASDVRAFGAKSCAGLDCLANKGIVLARMFIPGLPTPIDLYNIHMNSRGASKAPTERHFAAHDRQALEASEFIDSTHDDNYPVIFGGDFNMRRSVPRWENFSRYQSLTLVHRVCADPGFGCEVKMSWDGDEPWMDTQDLQFYFGGNPVSVRPIRVEAVFDGGPTGRQLSDHDGYMVTYRFEWPASTPNGFSC
jgi:endonuclease/exonuclease/phosphatase family metal-dependent hydrolase